MSIFKSIFGSSDTVTPRTSKIDWIQLTDIGQLNEIQEVSNQKPAIIFKHSTTCSISRMALKNFEREFDLHDKIEVYFLDLLNFRAISNEIASKFKVVHQSPQLLLIKNGISVYDVSHDSIDADLLKAKV